LLRGRLIAKAKRIIAYRCLQGKRAVQKLPVCTPESVDGVFQGFAGTELGHARLLDLDSFARARVTTRASSALGHGEGTETNQRNCAFLFERSLDRANERIKRPAGVCLGQISLGGDVFDELCFVHLRITPEDNFLPSVGERLAPKKTQHPDGAGAAAAARQKTLRIASSAGNLKMAPKMPSG